MGMLNPAQGGMTPPVEPLAGASGTGSQCDHVGFD
jgi:hypothetical protein